MGDKISPWIRQKTAPVKLAGTVVLVKSNVLGFNDFVHSFLDGFHELVGSGITFELVSATVGDPKKENRGKVGKPAQLEKWLTTGTMLAAGDSHFHLTFEWDEQLGIPGAVIVKNNHHGEFFLKSLTLEGVPGPKSRIHFVCNSWVYPVSTYNYDRIFFANDVSSRCKEKFSLERRERREERGERRLKVEKGCSRENLRLSFCLRTFQRKLYFILYVKKQRETCFYKGKGKEKLLCVIS